MGQALADIRSRIDALDARLVKLISARARLAQRIGGLKQGKVYRPEREAQVLRRVRQVNRGPLSNAALARLFTEIVSACRALEDEMAVAYLGPAGTFSQEAALKHFGGQKTTRQCVSIDEVFRQVETGVSGYGVVPVENSTEGAVGRTLDLLLTASSARVCGEVMLPVRQCLMSKVRKHAGIRKVYSHTQSLAQCQGWLARHLPHAERIAAVSNAEAARLAAKERGAAAIGSRTAAGLYGLTVLARNVEDEPNNTTRFVVIAQQDAAPSGRDKTSLILATRNVPGAMHELLTPLAENGVSMTRLESRPARTGLWEYLFYVDIEGHQQEPKVAKALAGLEGKASFVKNLGSYPAAAA
jgi:chorismate mutase / prephenate dehydratase